MTTLAHCFKVGGPLRLVQWEIRGWPRTQPGHLPANKEHFHVVRCQ